MYSRESRSCRFSPFAIFTVLGQVKSGRKFSAMLHCAGAVIRRTKFAVTTKRFRSILTKQQ
jgi:hypothetical protein